MDATADRFELEILLAPVSEETPAGADLREDFSPQSLYYRLRDARAEARAAERAADADPEIEAPLPPEWRTVAALAREALVVSKDLEVAAWYTEALLRSDGLEGLAAGSHLMAELAERFWDALYPLPDEDGIATRVAPVGGLNGESGDGTLIQPLRKLPMFARPDGAVLSYWQFEQALQAAGMDQAARQRRLDAGVLPFDKIEAEARAVGAASLAALLAAAERALEAWGRLSECLDRLAGADSPSTSRVRELLEQIREATSRYVTARPEAPGGEAGVEAGAPDMSGGEMRAARGPVASREDALRQLDQLADFFRRTEPNSPLAYTLQEASRRARMTWPELLAEIVPDWTSRVGILTALGIKPPEETG